MCNPMRMAIALSGGVDSSIAALFLSRCVYTFDDVYALWCTSTPVPSATLTCNDCAKEFHSTCSFCYWTPSYETVRESIMYKLPWHSVHPFYREYKEWGTNVNRSNCAMAAIEKIPLYMRNLIDGVEEEEEEESESCQNNYIYNEKNVMCNDKNDNNNSTNKIIEERFTRNRVKEHAMWCSQSEADYNDAHTLAHELRLMNENSKLPIVDLSAEYMDRCFEPMLNAYARGQTLNVDVLCNSEIKFGALLEHFAKRNMHDDKKLKNEQSEEEEQQQKQREQYYFCSLDKALIKRKKKCNKIDLLATGHYARSVHCYPNLCTYSCALEGKKKQQEEEEESELASGLQKERLQTRAHSYCSAKVINRNAEANDRSVLLGCPVSANYDLNDQSLFLSYVSSHLLKKGVFPCGHLFTRKADLRALATDLSVTLHIPILNTIAHKKTSTGLCFVSQSSPSRKKQKKQPLYRKESNMKKHEDNYGSNNCSECLLNVVENSNDRRNTKLQKRTFVNFLDRYILSPHECVSDSEATQSKSVTINSGNSICKTQICKCDEEQRCNVTTLFRDIEQNKLLDQEKFVSLPSLTAHYPHRLPSFALTIGQRLLYMSDHSDHDGSKSSNEKRKKNDFSRTETDGRSKTKMNKMRHSYETYFVCEKVHAELENLGTNTMAPVAELLDEVHLVHTWNHAQLYYTKIKILKVKVHITLEQLHTLVENYKFCKDTNMYDCMTLKCLCVIRHQDKPQPAIVQWERQHETWQECKLLTEENVDDLYITQATVTFDQPIRAPAAGQVTALYYSAQKLMKIKSNNRSEMDFECKNTFMENEDDNNVLVVIACG